MQVGGLPILANLQPPLAGAQVWGCCAQALTRCPLNLSISYEGFLIHALTGRATFGYACSQLSLLNSAGRGGLSSLLGTVLFLGKGRDSWQPGTGQTVAL